MELSGGFQKLSAVALVFSSFLGMEVECFAFVLAHKESFLWKTRFLKQEDNQNLFLILKNV